MRRISMISLSALMFASAAPAFAETTPGAPTAAPETVTTVVDDAAPAAAQDAAPAEAAAPASPFTISANATLVSDYRFRGFSQTGENGAIQGTINLNHESGFYIGTFGSSVGFAGHTEVDLYGGYTKTIGGITLDGGLLYYLYPKKGNADTDFFEPYINVSGTVGPVTAKVGANFAWGGQAALGDNSAVYLHGDLTAAIPKTPFGLAAHIGYAKSDAFPGGIDGDVIDYSIGATATYKSLTFGVTYVNTDETNSTFGGLFTGGYKNAIGADGAVVFSLTAAMPAAGSDTSAPSSIKITGGATLVSDYRFRGFTQNNENAAIQGTINLTHDSGFYVGTWASSVGFAGNTEVDLYGGYSKTINGITLDGGLLYYLYPKHGNADTDYFEPYVNVSGTLGPVTAKVGANYAWGGQAALGDYSSIYFHGDLTAAIPKTPFSLTGHLGYAKSDSFLGGVTGDVVDYSVGATATWKALTFGVSYVNTNETNVLNAKELLGADGAVIFSIGASF
ncbi:TorF family putative porin [Sphingomonas alpina]|nr:TorF family putative porin [Sphingomonas alpina]